MNLIRTIKHVEVIVNGILFENPDARDDDNLLVCEYLKTLDYEDFTDVAELIKEKKIATKFKTVERVRRKLQEHNPDLRGKEWMKRHMAKDDFRHYSTE